MGWECPKCGKIWAPSVEECADCNKTRTPAWAIEQFPGESTMKKGGTPGISTNPQALQV
jgi:hypothetical protein